MRRFRRWIAALMTAAVLAPGFAVAQDPPAKPPAAPSRPAADKPAAGAPAPAAPAPAAPVKPPPISEQIQQIRAQLDNEKADLDQREKALSNRDLNKDDLAMLREGIDPVADRLRQVIDNLGPRLEAAKERLNQIGPKPKDAPEAQDVAEERAQREAAVAETDDTLRIARSLLVQSEQISDQISNRRRTAFTRALFERTDPLVSPDLWQRALGDVPRDLKSLESSAADAMVQVQRNGTPLRLLLVALAIGVSVALYIGRRHIAPAVGHRASSARTPERGAKVLAAWRVFLIGAVPAVLGSFVVGYTVDVTDVMPARLLTVFHSLLGAIAFVAVVEAMADALLSPGRPAWRLIAMEDATAERINRLAVGIAIVITGGRTIEALNAGISVGLPVTIVTKGLFALVVAVVLAIGLRRFAARAETEEACLGPYVAAESSTGIGGPLRLVGWIVVAAIAASAVTGYIALSSFLINQLLWTAVAASMLTLCILSVDSFVGGALQNDSGFATALQANTGLRKRSLNQIAVLITGFVRVVLLTAAAVILLATWGVDSTDLLASARAAFFGFKVGDVTISLSTIAVALALFAVGIVIARSVKRWLENTYLPATDLDLGLRNSIATIAGYVGFLVALAVAFSYLGLSLEKVTIVAGALSVGIGFGLQSIVNNFVSGLLLLWERPIRVGDLVVIGDNEGYVRRISVRSTEIQTFDRSAVIVPNSNLISGVVKNRVRGDRVGRVAITVNVLRNQDPVNAAELIVSCAKAHADVLKEPPPRVVFRKIGDPFLEFELIAMITDVGSQLKVQSDLNFAVFRTLSEKGLIPNLGPGASIVTVQGLEPMQDALGMIARTVGTTSVAVPGRGAAEDRPAGEAPAAEARRRTPESVP
ncbi:DUF3772 domain-containing protein [uncultured Methylobacterium sp.]|jgi:potassium efflux system protein|uniref:DUF3772 domain-containing protein n=1 Tax=uncultured Methylobacterium sp. TaxID=157278 RepID=UPI002632F6B3|nr:DUF3772 domain-containing protein [uncultured Methylobacterium sp.]